MVIVLVVDDESDIRSALSEVLTFEGYEVVSACDGVEALELARTHHPELVLLDLMMPRMSGWEFREAQKVDPEVSQIPVVILSAVSPGPETSLDDTEYIAKPFDLDVLMSAVRRHAPQHHQA